jgi:uncharacterized membrane protein YqhA
VGQLSLVITVIVGGYKTFVSRMQRAGKPTPDLQAG